MKISACVITKNEEENIARSIASYQDIVSEIIVVDSESTDDTVKIAQSMGARVYTRPWTNDFAAAKNYAMERATGDWILFLDADEYFAPGHAEIVKKMVLLADKQREDFILSPRHETHQNSTEVIGICYVERAFRRDPQIRYHNPIHEYLRHADGSIRRLCTDEFVIIHTGYDPGLVQDKMERNLKLLLSDQCEESPMRHLYLMEVYAGLGKHEEVIKEADFLMTMPDFREISLYEKKIFRGYIFKIRAMMALGDRYSRAQIEEVAERVMLDFADHPEVRAALSDLHLHYGETENAIEHFEQALVLGKQWEDSRYNNMFAGDFSGKFLHLAGLYKASGDRGGECRCLLAALEENKKNESALFEFLIVTEGLPVEDRNELLKNIYDNSLTEDLMMMSKMACLAGSNELLMDSLLRLKESGQIRLEDDAGVFGRLLFLQHEYDEMIDLAKAHMHKSENQQESLYQRILFEAQLAKSYESSHADKVEIDIGRYAQNFDLIAEVTMDLLQAKREDLIRHLFKALNIEKLIGTDRQEKKKILEKVFEKYRKEELYEDIGMRHYQK